MGIFLPISNNVGAFFFLCKRRKKITRALGFFSRDVLLPCENGQLQRSERRIMEIRRAFFYGAGLYFSKAIPLRNVTCLFYHLVMVLIGLRWEKIVLT